VENVGLSLAVPPPTASNPIMIVIRKWFTFPANCLNRRSARLDFIVRPVIGSTWRDSNTHLLL
jgi:hypothetical protein